MELFSIDGYNSAKGVEASMNNVGITVLLALIGVGITGILVIKNVKGNILWGILITWILESSARWRVSMYRIQKLDSTACFRISARIHNSKHHAGIWKA